MRLSRKTGIVLWDALATLPVASGITGAVGGLIEVNNEYKAEWGWLEIWRSDLVKATSILTLAGNAVANETVTIDTQTYTWKASVTTTANQVKIGASASDSIDNLIAAITGGAGSGTLYGSATVTHTTVTAAVGAGDTMGITALVAGTAANAYATTETMTDGSWTSTVMAGGLDQNTTDSTITGPISLWGYNGTRWLFIQNVQTANLAVNGVRGAGFYLRGMGVYSRLALSAANATPSGTTPTISATYSPVFSH